jgi:hypothetical protein
MSALPNVRTDYDSERQRLLLFVLMGGCRSGLPRSMADSSVAPYPMGVARC